MFTKNFVWFFTFSILLSLIKTLLWSWKNPSWNVLHSTLYSLPQYYSTNTELKNVEACEDFYVANVRPLRFFLLCDHPQKHTLTETHTQREKHTHTGTHNEGRERERKKMKWRSVSCVVTELNINTGYNNNEYDIYHLYIVIFSSITSLSVCEALSIWVCVCESLSLCVSVSLCESVDCGVFGWVLLQNVSSKRWNAL